MRAASTAIFNRCREAEINFFDCANVYAEGESERILGGLIQGCRDEVVITTKVFGRIGMDINAGGTSRRHIMASVEQSLRRLKTDHIDVFFLHHFDEETDMEDSLRALDDLVKQGKILYPAASNYAAWQIMKAGPFPGAKDGALSGASSPCTILVRAPGGGGDPADGGV